MLCEYNLKCDITCLTCSGSLNNQCYTCNSNLYYLDGYCLQQCPSSKYYPIDFPTKQCLNCDPYCEICTGPKATDCLLCVNNLYLQYNQCV